MGDIRFSGGGGGGGGGTTPNAAAGVLWFPQAAVGTTIDRVTATTFFTSQSQNGNLLGFIWAGPTGSYQHLTYYVNTAAATITGAQIAVYSIAANGDMAQLGAVNSASLLSATGAQTVALASAVTLTNGNAYAISTYFNGTTMPVMVAGVIPANPFNTAGLVVQPFLTQRTPASTSAPGATILYSSLTATLINGFAPLYIEIKA